MGVKWCLPWVMIFGWILWVLPPAGLAAPPAEPGTAFSAEGVNRIGVVPFFKGRHGSTMTESITCPVCQLYLDPASLSPIADRVVTDYVTEALQARLGGKVVPLGEASRAYGVLSPDERRESPLTIAQQLGQSLTADAMIAGTIWKYQERVPDVDQPASIAFALFLIEVATGKVLWQATFSETQKSLSDNVIDIKSFLKKGGRWLSASELARYGVREVFEGFPW